MGPQGGNHWLKASFLSTVVDSCSTGNWLGNEHKPWWRPTRSYCRLVAGNRNWKDDFLRSDCQNGESGRFRCFSIFAQVSSICCWGRFCQDAINDLELWQDYFQKALYIHGKLKIDRAPRTRRSHIYLVSRAEKIPDRIGSYQPAGHFLFRWFPTLFAWAYRKSIAKKCIIIICGCEEE